MNLRAFIKRHDNLFIVYAILLAVAVVGAVSSPRFLTGINLGNIMEQAVGLGIVALGQVLTILLAGIDLSVGAVVSMSTAIMSLELSGGAAGILLNILLTLAAGALVGVFNGFGIVRLRIPPFIMTLSTMCIVNGVALKIRPVPGGSIPYEFMDLLFGRIGIFPHAVLLWAVAGALLVWLLAKLCLPEALGALCAAAFPWLVTGFLHLDGYMDVCDAVLSRRDLATRQKILKDSHCGAFAVIAMVLLALTQWIVCQSVSLNEIPLLPLAALPCAVRAAAALAVSHLRPLSTSQYAAQPKPPAGHTAALVLMLAAACVLPPLFCGMSGFAPLIGAAGYGLAVWYAFRQLDGMSGDVSGFALTLGELAGLAFLFLTRYYL